MENLEPWVLEAEGPFLGISSRERKLAVPWGPAGTHRLCPAEHVLRGIVKPGREGVGGKGSE